MQNTTNGASPSPTELLDSLRFVIDRLEAKSSDQQAEIERLKAERHELRQLLIGQNKSLLADPKEWEQIDESEFTLTIDDLLAAVRSR